MNSDSINNSAELTGALSSLNIWSNDELNNNEENKTICAACGKEGGEDSMNTCNKCDLVVYCNASCKKKHRSKHKKKCEKRVAELFDEKLFQEPTPCEECPICFLPMPLNLSQSAFESCCGKLICIGCSHSMRETGGENMKLCPFCKTPNAKSQEEETERIKKLMKKGNAYAFYNLAGHYLHGTMGMPRDRAKANELYLKAGELGCAEGYFNLGVAYEEGRGVTLDKKKAMHYYELAAMNGSVKSRHNLGVFEHEGCDLHRAIKHYIIAARAGCKESLDVVKKGYTVGIVTKDEYANTLRAYQNSQDEVKSEARDKAWAAINEMAD